MRLLVLGAGAVGGYFGGRLAASGADITFLVRPARARALAEHGLAITSPLGDLRVRVATITEATGSFDAVLLACKAYDLASATEAIEPAVGPETLILPLLNGLRHLDDLDARFGRVRVLGGLCDLGVRLGPAGEVEHLNRLERLVLGAREAGQVEGAAALHAALAMGGFAPDLSADIPRDMWEKFVFLAAYAGVTTLMRAPIGTILAADDGMALACELLGECIGVATESGFAPRPPALERAVATLTDRNSRGTASMFRDMARGGRTEHAHVVGDMLARARALGVAAPLLRVCLANLQAYDAERGRA